MSEILEQNGGDFYMDVREFSTGGVEVMLKAIRPMHEAAIKSVADPDSYTNFCKANDLPSAIYDRRRWSREDEDEGSKESRAAANHQRAVRRSKQSIRWLARQGGFDRLLTLSYRENMTDREKLKADVKRFLRLVRGGWGGGEGEKNWRYVAVIEKQERGAYHVHLAIKGWQRLTFLRKAWAKALGGTGEETGEQTLGNIDVTSPRKARWGTKLREWKNDRLSAYLTKYLAKTFDENDGDKKRYWHSADLEKPVRQRFIFNATDVLGAFKEAVGVLWYAYGIDIDFSRSWSSSACDSFWFSIGKAA